MLATVLQAIVGAFIKILISLGLKKAEERKVTKTLDGEAAIAQKQQENVNELQSMRDSNGKIVDRVAVGSLQSNAEALADATKHTNDQL